MRRYALFVLIPLALIAALTLPSSANAYFYYGFAISDCADLQAMDDDPNSFSGAFYLTNDIDCAGATIDALLWGANKFAGILDGNNFTISNFDIDNVNQPAGLFQEVSGATIFDLKIAGATITTQSISGILAGTAKQSTITNVHTDGTVASTGFAAGGLVGQSEDSTIDGSSSAGTVNALFLGGGLVGYQNSLAVFASVIRYSWSTANVNTVTAYAAGGLVGQASSYGYGDNATVLISDSYATGDVSASNTIQVGGLVGLFTAEAISTPADSIIQRSYSSGDATGDEYVGGLVGQASNIDDPDTDLTIVDSFTNSFVSGNANIAGFVGSVVQSDHPMTSSNNAFGVVTTGEFDCAGNIDLSGSCYGINDAGPFFLGNDTNAPMSSWGFASSDWEVVADELPALVRDVDQDGATSTLERNAPNGGDFDGDTVQDSEQDEVASFTYLGEYQNVAITNGYLDGVNPQSRASVDEYEFPFGVIRFLVFLNPGESTDIEVSFRTDEPLNTFNAVKYSDEEDTVNEIVGATLSEETVDGDRYIKISYSATDGGANDEDGTENGFIVDPVAIAVFTGQQVTTTTAATTTTQVVAAPESTTTEGTLSNTGAQSIYLATAAILLIGGGIAIVQFRRRKVT